MASSDLMPGPSGVDVYKRLAALRPGLERRVVFVTGGTFMTELAAFVTSTGNPVLAKPFQIAQVLAAIATAARS